MDRGLIVVVLGVSLLAGCRAGAIGDEAGDSASGTSQSSESAGLTSSGAESGTELGSTDAGSDFVVDTGSCCGGDDEWGVRCVFSCSVLGQDCPDGEKCVPYSSAGEASFDASKCVLVVGDRPPNEPCSYDGFSDSTDDCDADSFCFAFDEGPGYCRSFCTGTPDDPMCDDAFGCAAEPSKEFLALCLPTCDLAQPCDVGEGCYPWTTEPLLCLPAGPAEVGSTCLSVNGCVAGHLCLESLYVPDCFDDASCCTPMCDTADGQACNALPGTECVMLFEPGVEPELENVGVCVASDALP